MVHSFSALGRKKHGATWRGGVEINFRFEQFTLNFSCATFSIDTGFSGTKNHCCVRKFVSSSVGKNMRRKSFLVIEVPPTFRSQTPCTLWVCVTHQLMKSTSCVDCRSFVFVYVLIKMCAAVNKRLLLAIFILLLRRRTRNNSWKGLSHKNILSIFWGWNHNIA